MVSCIHLLSVPLAHLKHIGFAYFTRAECAILLRKIYTIHRQWNPRRARGAMPAPLHFSQVCKHKIEIL